jgi:hypothetical protein
MRKVPVDKDILSFNMTFAQIVNDYYLSSLREKEIVSANNPSYRYLPIDQLLNITILSINII